jgi:hypothetical protein
MPVGSPAPRAARAGVNATFSAENGAEGLGLRITVTLLFPR